MNNFNQYYGQQQPMQTPENFFQQPRITPQTLGMNSLPMAEPPRLVPSTQADQPIYSSQLIPMDQYQINQIPLKNHYASRQFQPAMGQNNMNMVYGTPPSIVSPQYSLNNTVMNPNQATSTSSPQNYHSPHPNPVSHFSIQPNRIPLQQGAETNAYPTLNQYSVDNQEALNGGTANSVQGNFSNQIQNINPTQINTTPHNTQIPYSMNSAGSQIPPTHPPYGGDTKPTQPVEAHKSEVNKKPESTKEVGNLTSPYLVGHFKCSDLPNLFTGPFRYASLPTQRKPFTMRGDGSKTNSKITSNFGDVKNGTLSSRQGKRWELRGGKYYGCFSSRTNGLQDICTKAKCRMCPNDIRKK